jgi:hypothetical protein
MESRGIGNNMKIRIFSILMILLLPLSSHAEQILGIGDSIMYGSFGATDGPLPTIGSYLSETYYNGAVPGSCINSTSSGLASLLASHTPSRVYCNAGINDIRTYANTCHSPMETWLLYYSSILTDVINAGATLYALQITPECNETYYPGQNPSSTIKLWNAYLEDWCFTNNVQLCPSYQDMSNPNNDDCLTNTSDGLHPKCSR